MFSPHLEPPLRQEAKRDAQDPGKQGGVKQEERLEDTVGGGRIRCPKCGWQPRKRDLWGCRCGCGCAWNTFDTGGKCPGCGVHWKNTQCFRCNQWSPHEDWYSPGTPGQGAAS